MQKSDWWCGLAIILISIFFIWGSLAMPWSDRGFDWTAAPGLTPVVLAVSWQLPALSYGALPDKPKVLRTAGEVHGPACG